MSGFPTVLAVTRSPGNARVLGKMLQREGYHSVAVRDADEMRAAVDSDGAVHLVVIDIGGFDREIWSACDFLRERDIPFLVISPRANVALQEQGLVRGASAVLARPVRVDVLRSMLRALAPPPTD